MRYLVAAVVFISIIIVSERCRADSREHEYGDAGWSYIAGAGSDRIGNISLITGLRFQYPRVVSLGLEVFAMMPYGLGIDIQVAGLSARSFSLRLMDIGFFYGREPGNRWVEHSWSLILGAGMEYRFFLYGAGARYAQLTLDYRAFLPDPGSVLMFYGDFGRDIYLGALRDGQFVIGAGVTF